MNLELLTVNYKYCIIGLIMYCDILWLELLPKIIKYSYWKVGSKMAFKLRGIKLPERKTTEGMPSVKMPAPETVTIPTAMHIGAPVKPVVKVGDEVFVGTLIAEDNEKLSAPVYSSVSGKVS